MAVLEQ